MLRCTCQVTSLGRFNDSWISLRTEKSMGKPTLKRLCRNRQKSISIYFPLRRFHLLLFHHNSLQMSPSFYSFTSHPSAIAVISMKTLSHCLFQTLYRYNIRIRNVCSLFHVKWKIRREICPLYRVNRADCNSKVNNL